MGITSINKLLLKISTKSNSTFLINLLYNSQFVFDFVFRARYKHGFQLFPKQGICDIYYDIKYSSEISGVHD